MLGHRQPLRNKNQELLRVLKLFEALNHQVLIDQVKTLLDAGADPNTIGEHGNPVLHAAVATRNLEVVELLLNYGADVNIRDNTLNSTLHLAVGIDHIEGAKLLIKYGADLNALNKAKCSPLLYALKLTKKPSDYLELFINAGVSFEDDLGFVFLKEICSKDDESVEGLNCLNFLLERNANPNRSDKFFGRTTLHLAARHGHLTYVNLLLWFGAEPLLEDSKGGIPRELTNDPNIQEILVSEEELRYKFEDAKKFISKLHKVTVSRHAETNTLRKETVRKLILQHGMFRPYKNNKLSHQDQCRLAEHYDDKQHFSDDKFDWKRDATLRRILGGKKFFGAVNKPEMSENIQQQSSAP